MVQGSLEGVFIIRVDGSLKTYNHYNQIPIFIDEIVTFEPNVPVGPHSPEEHEFIELWEYRLHILMRRSSNASRDKSR